MSRWTLRSLIVINNLLALAAALLLQFSFAWRLPILRVVLDEKIFQFERAVGSVDIDDVPEMKKGEVLVSSVGDGSFQR
jgi:hypothetical protein